MKTEKNATQQTIKCTLEELTSLFTKNAAFNEDLYKRKIIEFSQNRTTSAISSPENFLLAECRINIESDFRDFIQKEHNAFFEFINQMPDEGDDYDDIKIAYKKAIELIESEKGITTNYIIETKSDINESERDKKKERKRLLSNNQQNDYYSPPNLETSVFGVKTFRNSKGRTERSNTYTQKNLLSEKNDSFYLYKKIYIHCIDIIPQLYDDLIQLIKEIDIADPMTLESDDISITKGSEVMLLMNELGIIDFLQEKHPVLKDNHTKFAKILRHITNKNEDTLRRCFGDMGLGRKNDPYNSESNKEKIRELLEKYSLKSQQQG